VPRTGAPDPELASLAFPQAGAGAAAKSVIYGAAPVHRRVLADGLVASAWVDEHGDVWAILYKDELEALIERRQASYVSAAAPHPTMEVHLADAPPTRWDQATWRVRLQHQGAELPAGAGHIELSGGPRESLVVLAPAVLRGPDGPYVLALSPDRRTFGKRAIETGRTSAGFSVVVAGATEGELVVSMNAFTLDAERRRLDVETREVARP